MIKTESNYENIVQMSNSIFEHSKIIVQLLNICCTRDFEYNMPIVDNLFNEQQIELVYDLVKMSIKFHGICYEWNYSKRHNVECTCDDDNCTCSEEKLEQIYEDEENYDNEINHDCFQQFFNDATSLTELTSLICRQYFEFDNGIFKYTNFDRKRN